MIFHMGSGQVVVVAQVREGKCVDAAATFSITQPFPSGCRQLTIKYLGGRKENAQINFAGSMSLYQGSLSIGPGGETLNLKSEMFSKLALLDI